MARNKAHHGFVRRHLESGWGTSRSRFQHLCLFLCRHSMNIAMTYYDIVLRCDKLILALSRSRIETHWNQCFVASIAVLVLGGGILQVAFLSFLIGFIFMVLLRFLIRPCVWLLGSDVFFHFWLLYLNCTSQGLQFFWCFSSYALVVACAGSAASNVQARLMARLRELQCCMLQYGLVTENVGLIFPMK